MANDRPIETTIIATRPVLRIPERPQSPCSCAQPNPAPTRTAGNRGNDERPLRATGGGVEEVGGDGSEGHHLGMGEVDQSGDAVHQGEADGAECNNRAELETGDEQRSDALVRRSLRGPCPHRAERLPSSPAPRGH